MENEIIIAIGTAIPVRERKNLHFYVKYSIINSEKHLFTPFFTKMTTKIKNNFLGGFGMSTSEFTKPWDNVNGYTMREAMEKKAKVDEAHGVGTPESRWNPAEIVPDTSKKDGFKVVIRTK